MSVIRKQVKDLTNHDFEEHPAWEQASDEEDIPGQDEDTYRSVSYEGAVDGSAIVRTQFILADGTILMGYLVAEIFEEDRTCSGLRPVIITAGAKIHFWLGISSEDSVSKIYETLKRKPFEIFPVQYLSLHPVINGPISGTIECFAGLDAKTFEEWSGL